MASKPPKPENAASSPRHKSRKANKAPKPKEAGEPNPIIWTDHTSLTSNISNDVKIAFAEMVMTYSAMEMTIEHIIWDITGLSYDDGKLFTQIDISKKVDLLQKLIERYGLIIHYDRKTVKEMWQGIRSLMPVRNLAVHGIWAMFDNKFPIVASYRLNSTLGHIDAQPFDVDRLKAMANQAQNVKVFLDNFHAKILDSRQKQI
jgi:hypothetical protein